MKEREKRARSPKNVEEAGFIEICSGIDVAHTFCDIRKRLSNIRKRLSNVEK